MAHSYVLPIFLHGSVSQQQYSRWLHRKAAAHVRRDRARTGVHHALAEYKSRIHTAVSESAGKDWYTGEALNWALISQYNNEESKAGRSAYKANFALLPTVDHVAIGNGSYDFVICGWRTNDAKHDMALPEFLELCRLVLERHGPASGASSIQSG